MDEETDAVYESSASLIHDTTPVGAAADDDDNATATAIATGLQSGQTSAMQETCSPLQFSETTLEPAAVNATPAHTGSTRIPIHVYSLISYIPTGQGWISK